MLFKDHSFTTQSYVELWINTIDISLRVSHVVIRLVKFFRMTVSAAHLHFVFTWREDKFYRIKQTAKFAHFNKMWALGQRNFVLILCAPFLPLCSAIITHNRIDYIWVSSMQARSITAETASLLNRDLMHFHLKSLSLNKTLAVTSFG